jgi:hypothetical protein
VRYSSVVPNDREKKQIGHARAMFDNYIRATASFTRQKEVPGRPGFFNYSEETVVSDMLAFSKVYMCVWEVIQSGAKDWYRSAPDLFINIRHIVTPHPTPDDTRHVQFWVPRADNSRDIEPGDVRADKLVAVAETLRHGFGHFNYRYHNMTPEAYFKDLGPALPLAIKEPQRAGEFDRRIFIFDGKSGGSAHAHIVETTFGHLRYHLACFLARFFTEHAGAAPYTDILTGRTLTRYAEPFR